HEDLTISGTVVRGGQPVAGVNVVVQPRGMAKAQSGADGSFVITGLSTGTYTVGILGENGHFLHVNVAAKAGGKNVRLELPPVGAIAGELSGFSGATDVIAQGTPGVFYVRGAHDHFSIDEVPEGPYEVNAVSEDGKAAHASITVAAGT